MQQVFFHSCSVLCAIGFLLLFTHELRLKLMEEL